MKRKASELDDQISSTSWSPSSNSSISLDGSPNRRAIAPVPWSCAPSRGQTDRYLNVRTRKRVRDNRPDVETIHENTLAKLFNAQRQQHSLRANTTSMNPPTADTIVLSDLQNTTKPSQRDLHSFFDLGQRPAAVKHQSLSIPQQVRLLCDDCGNDLSRGAGDLSDMMDIDNTNSAMLEEAQCVSCKRNVCDMCAVRGDYRVCLECAMPGGG